MIIKGQKINDRYQIIRTIGEGGMANVYLAYDTILERNVAVKILRGDLADDEKFVRRFQREAISASSLSHPNIVEMYDVGEDDGKYFIVMEFVDGKTLKSLIKRRGALSLPEVIDIMLQLTSAISCAHDSYIIHRDIKPQNVLILEDGTVKITDFGIAMALNSNELTQTNSVMGSVHYLPPEQANGTGSTIKSDIYSLGILMYELLIGKVPFKGENAVEIAIKQMKDKIPSICEINPSIPQSIENIIINACAKNPKNRYDNVNEMHEDIRSCLDENRANELKTTYKYPEQDVEETKVMPAIPKNIDKKKLFERKQHLNEGSKESSTNKKLDLALIITGSILFILIALVCVFLIIFPKITEVKEVVIPDVKNLTVIEAEELLKSQKLNVDVEILEESNDIIPEGKIINTNPRINQSVKENATITLIVSTGSKKVLIENYINKLYFEVKAKLEEKGLIVTIERQEVDSKDKVKENIVLSQSIKEGESVTLGTQIILKIPDIVTEYPDFVNEGWKIDQIKSFCEEYNINLTVVEKETTEYAEGTVISQSREPGVRVVANAPLKITVAKSKDIEPDINDIISE